MNNAKQDAACRSCVEQADSTFFSLKNELEVEKSDRQKGHQYLPMDVYVDTATIKEHFQAASIRERSGTEH